MGNQACRSSKPRAVDDDEQVVDTRRHRDLPLEVRRLHGSLIKAVDSVELSRKPCKKSATAECWFVVDAVWLRAWLNFVTAKEEDRKKFPQPPPVTNWRLFRIKTKCENLKTDLAKSKDYRFVNPSVWALFVTLYGVPRPVGWTADSAGKDNLAIARRTMELYGTQDNVVAQAEMEQVLMVPVMAAQKKVAKVIAAVETSMVRDKQSNVVAAASCTGKTKDKSTPAADAPRDPLHSSMSQSLLLHVLLKEGHRNNVDADKEAATGGLQMPPFVILRAWFGSKADQNRGVRAHRIDCTAMMDRLAEFQRNGAQMLQEVKEEEEEVEEEPGTPPEPADGLGGPESGELRQDAVEAVFFDDNGIPRRHKPWGKGKDKGNGNSKGGGEALNEATAAVKLQARVRGHQERHRVHLTREPAERHLLGQVRANVRRAKQLAGEQRMIKGTVLLALAHDPEGRRIGDGLDVHGKPLGLGYSLERDGWMEHVFGDPCSEGDDTDDDGAAKRAKRGGRPQRGVRGHSKKSGSGSHASPGHQRKQHRPSRLGSFSRLKRSSPAKSAAGSATKQRQKGPELSDEEEEHGPPRMLHVKYEYCGLHYEVAFAEDESVLIAAPKDQPAHGTWRPSPAALRKLSPHLEEEEEKRKQAARRRRQERIARRKAQEAKLEAQGKGKDKGTGMGTRRGSSAGKETMAQTLAKEAAKQKQKQKQAATVESESESRSYDRIVRAARSGGKEDIYMMLRVSATQPLEELRETVARWLAIVRANLPPGGEEEEGDWEWDEEACEWKKSRARIEREARERERQGHGHGGKSANHEATEQTGARSRRAYVLKKWAVELKNERTHQTLSSVGYVGEMCSWGDLLTIGQATYTGEEHSFDDFKPNQTRPGQRKGKGNGKGKGKARASRGAANGHVVQGSSVVIGGSDTEQEDNENRGMHTPPDADSGDEFGFTAGDSDADMRALELADFTSIIDPCLREMAEDSTREESTMPLLISPKRR